MIPKTIKDLSKADSILTDKAWQKAKSIADKTGKTGLGPVLVTLQSLCKTAQNDLALLDAGSAGRLVSEDVILAAIKTAQQKLAAGTVKMLLDHLGVTATKAEAVAKMKLSAGAKQAAQKIAAAAKQAKFDLETERFADFKVKLDTLRRHLAEQRKDFTNSAKLFIDLLNKVEKAPTIKNIKGTTFSGPHRNFQNKVGHLPELKPLFDDKYDGLLYEEHPFEKWDDTQAKPVIVKYIKEAKAYYAKVMKGAAANGLK